MTQNKATSSGSFVENLLLVQVLALASSLLPYTRPTSSSLSTLSAHTQMFPSSRAALTHPSLLYSLSPIVAVFTLTHLCCNHSHPSLLYSLTQVHLLAACSALLAHSMYTGGRIVPAQSECVCVGVCICVYPFNKGLCVCVLYKTE
jgi:hypothetical protein